MEAVLNDLAEQPECAAATEHVRRVLGEEGLTTPFLLLGAVEGSKKLDPPQLRKVINGHPLNIAQAVVLKSLITRLRAGVPTTPAAPRKRKAAGNGGAATKKTARADNGEKAATATTRKRADERSNDDDDDDEDDDGEDGKNDGGNEDEIVDASDAAAALVHMVCHR